MDDAFDRLFCQLPHAFKRHEDGTIYVDKSHPDVQKVIVAIRQCYEAGSTVDDVKRALLRGLDEGFRRAEEATDGTHP
jgi:myo-inositol-hexaphosphate 3-phosphohydrolase